MSLGLTVGVGACVCWNCCINCNPQTVILLLVNSHLRIKMWSPQGKTLNCKVKTRFLVRVRGQHGLFEVKKCKLVSVYICTHGH